MTPIDKAVRTDLYLQYKYLVERLIFINNIMNITDSKKLGNIIKNKRKELGYTQSYVSEYTGLSISFISDVENGKKTVELGKVIQLLNILGLDMKIESRG